MISAFDHDGHPRHGCLIAQRSPGPTHASHVADVGVASRAPRAPSRHLFERSLILLSRTTVRLRAHASERVLSFGDFNGRVNQAARLLTTQDPTVQLGDTLIGGDLGDCAMDSQMAFILEKLA